MHKPQSFKVTVKGLVAAVDAKDPYTRGHSERVAGYAVAIGEELGFDRQHLETLEYAALLHDIGKIGIDLELLHKSKELSNKEYSILHHHPALGAKIIEPIKFLSKSIPGIRHHHERYDGKGYPDGLKGEEIPVDACIICVADAFDAITTNRAYSKAQPFAAAVDILVKGSGSQFNPKIVEAFINVYKKKYKK